MGQESSCCCCRDKDGKREKLKEEVDAEDDRGLGWTLEVPWVQRGEMLHRAGKSDKARAAFTAAINANPDSPEAYAARGKLFEECGKYRKALKDYVTAMDITSSRPEYFVDAGRMLFLLGDRPRAMYTINQGLQRDPKFVPGYVARAQVRDADGDKAGALKDFERAISMSDEPERMWKREVARLRKIVKKKVDIEVEEEEDGGQTFDNFPIAVLGDVERAAGDARAPYSCSVTSSSSSTRGSASTDSSSAQGDRDLRINANSDSDVGLPEYGTPTMSAASAGSSKAPGPGGRSDTPSGNQSGSTASDASRIKDGSSTSSASDRSGTPLTDKQKKKRRDDRASQKLLPKSKDRDKG